MIGVRHDALVRGDGTLRFQRPTEPPLPAVKQEVVLADRRGRSPLCCPHVACACCDADCESQLVTAPRPQHSAVRSVKWKSGPLHGCRVGMRVRCELPGYLNPPSVGAYSQAARFDR